MAIIGAGWAGLQLLQSLLERGIEAALFDKLPMVGGTWTPDMSYQDLHLHSAAWLGAFEGMPFSDCQRVNDAKPSAQEMNRYCQRFVDQNNLADRIHLSCTVAEVRYSTATRKATLLTKQLDRSPRSEGPFDLVVYASLSGKPDVPKIPHSGFEGLELHSSGLKPEVLQDILANGRRVAVVGAGKSGADMVAALHCSGHKEVTWVIRKPYFYFRFEVLFHQRSLLAKLRSLLCLVGMLLSRFFPTLGLLVLWLIGYVTLPSGFHLDATKFHFGVLDKSQLANIRSTPTRRGDPEALEKDGLRLKDGSLVPCDAVIWATGYSTGVDLLNLYKDDVRFTDLEGGLFDHLLLPKFPCLMSAATGFFHFGPKRSVSTAEYIGYHLRRDPLTEEQMLQSVERLRARFVCTRFFAYQSKSCLTQDWVSMYEDFYWLGFMRISSFVIMAIETFAFGVCNPLKLHFPLKS